MKQITITIPDNCELKQDGNTYTIVEKEKKVTYKDIARELFKDEKAYYVGPNGIIATAHCLPNTPFNCTSKRQAEKLLAINKLMNVAKYFNGDWQPDWNNTGECKYYIQIRDNKISIGSVAIVNFGGIYFKSEELAQQAIKILGEETIKFAICTDY